MERRFRLRGDCEGEGDGDDIGEGSVGDALNREDCSNGSGEDDGDEGGSDLCFECIRDLIGEGEVMVIIGEFANEGVIGNNGLPLDSIPIPFRPCLSALGITFGRFCSMMNDGDDGIKVIPGRGKKGF